MLLGTSHQSKGMVDKIAYMWNLKYGANEPMYKTDSQTEIRLVVAKGEVGRGEGWAGSLGVVDANYYI